MVHTPNEMMGHSYLENSKILDAYKNILTSWEIDPETASSFQANDGMLFFTQDGELKSCPACDYTTYNSILRDAKKEELSQIGSRVKEHFWRVISKIEADVTLDTITKNVSEKDRLQDERIRDIEYIHYLLGIPDVDVLEEVIRPYIPFDTYRNIKK